MTDKPILFSAPMVRALLDGRKTMTRRVLKPQPIEVLGSGRRVYADADWKKTWGDGYGDDADLKHRVGDTLWVREAWRADDRDTDHMPPSKIPQAMQILYSADGDGWHKDDPTVGKKRPSIFLPRWASRITLRVTAVKVERLQDISEEDAMAEGARWTGASYYVVAGNHWPTAVAAFANLWTSINGPGSWEANPYVAADTFERVK